MSPMHVVMCSSSNSSNRGVNRAGWKRRSSRTTRVRIPRSTSFRSISRNRRCWRDALLIGTIYATLRSIRRAPRGRSFKSMERRRLSSSIRSGAFVRRGRGSIRRLSWRWGTRRRCCARYGGGGTRSRALRCPNGAHVGVGTAQKPPSCRFSARRFFCTSKLGSAHIVWARLKCKKTRRSHTDACPARTTQRTASSLRDGISLLGAFYFGHERGTGCDDERGEHEVKDVVVERSC